jgi:hypothetical protein
MQLRWISSQALAVCVALFLVSPTESRTNTEPKASDASKSNGSIEELKATLSDRMQAALAELNLEFVLTKKAAPSLVAIIKKDSPATENDASSTGTPPSTPPAERELWLERHKALLKEAEGVWKNRLRRELKTDSADFEALQKVALFVDYSMELEVLIGTPQEIASHTTHRHLRQLLPLIEAHIAQTFGFKMNSSPNGLMVDGDEFFEKLSKLKGESRETWIQNFVTQASGYRNSLRFYISYRDHVSSPLTHSVEAADLTRYLYVTETLNAVLGRP